MGFEFNLKHPTAFVAQGIEHLVIKEKNSPNYSKKMGYGILSRLLSVTIFPTILTAELVFKRIPKLILSTPTGPLPTAKVEKFNKNLDKVNKFALGLLFTPIGIIAGDGVPGLFLKSHKEIETIRPFGVETQFGKKVNKIYYPTTVEELQNIVNLARRDNKQISIIGAGMSQGSQTIPSDSHHIVINTKKMNQIEFGLDNVKVQSGATWEQIQFEANKIGKSVIVKQASDIFSVGGSIGINCHGWAHEFGAIASTVESLDIIDAHGELKTLTPNDELFGCFFGTLGYFGIIVSATLKLENNYPVIEKSTEVNLKDFIDYYNHKIKGQGIPLFGGRLSLDNLVNNPLSQVHMVTYEIDNSNQLNLQEVRTPHSDFQQEPKYGKRVERIALQALGRFSYFITRRLISMLWYKEKEIMFSQKRMTRNEALHPPINAFKMLQKSNLHTQWLQEYFIKEEHLPNFLRFLGAELKANDVRLINATIRPTPKDTISILPYAEQDRYGVVICFSQMKTQKELERTKNWILRIKEYVIDQGDIYYQAYMPFTTQEQFEKCYGKERVQNMRELKQKYDPKNLFSNSHTQKYFDLNPN